MYSIFSERLRTLRLERNLSQKELAKELGVSVSSIVRWESGALTKARANPNKPKILKSKK